MHFRGSADGADGHRQGHGAAQVAVGVHVPVGQRAVLAVAGRVGMGAGLDGPPVVAGGDAYRVDAVHDALVMGGGAPGVDHGEGVGLGDELGRLPAGDARLLQRGRRNEAAGRGGAPVGQIAQDAQVHPPAGQFGHARSHGLDGGVDGVGAHRVAGVIEQVDDQHRPHRRVGERAQLDAARPAAALDDAPAARIGQSHQLGAMGIERPRRAGQVVQVEHLNLADHHRLRRLGREAATGADELGRVADGGQHARLLDGHGDEIVAAVDEEIGGHTQRQGIGAQRVLDHVIGLAGSQPPTGQHGRLVVAQPRPFGHHRHALGQPQLIEAGQPRTFHANRHAIFHARLS